MEIKCRRINDINNDLFAKGGDYLSAVQVTTCLPQEWEVYLPLTKLIECPGLGEFASLADEETIKWNNNRNALRKLHRKKRIVI